MSAEHLNELIDRLNRGDDSAAEEVFARYEPYLRMVVRRRLAGQLRAKLDSDDVVQSVFADVLVAFRKGDSRFDSPEHLRVFLARAARNRLIDRGRQHRRALERESPLSEVDERTVTAADQPRPSEVVRGDELWGRMLTASPPAHREVIALKRQGYTLAEIAGRTGRHRSSVRRIIDRLARRLSGGGDDRGGAGTVH